MDVQTDGDDPRLIELLLRWEELREQGRSVTPDELCSTCPELAEVLGRRIELLQRLDRLFEDPTTTAEGEPRAAAAPNRGSAAARAEFRDLRFHAAGALGEVFMARDAELNRQVALKFLKPERARDADSRRRFLREAEVTGRLEHPGVVPIYALGTDPDGARCYAMRFIHGETLQDAIDAFHAEAGAGSDPSERSLALRELLNRFVSICNTVAYAHSRGILHRDLKPSNVMLGKYGETLVVDWGLARPFDRDDRYRSAGEETLTPRAESEGDGSDTPTVGVVGTPAYMSPEQAEARWDLVGPASDIFALGGILYTMLAGRAAYRGRAIGAILEKVRQCEFPPPRQVRPGVPRALEAVCLKAMARRIEDRYASALDLAEDVRRWLADEPVTAGGEPWVDRLRRRMRRHRSFVLLAVASILLVNLALFGWSQMKAADYERRQARLVVIEQEGKARVERARAAEKERISRTLADFIVKLFQTTDPLGLENRGFRTPTERMDAIAALRMLEVGVERLDLPLDLGDSAALVRATLIDTIGNALRATGEFRRARPLIEEALRIRTASLPQDDPDVAMSLFHMAMLDHFSGRFETAEKSYAAAVGILSKAHAGDEMLLDKVEFHRAWALAEMKRLAEAGAMFDRVLERRKQRLGKDHADTRHAQFASYIVTLGSGDREVLLREAVKLALTGDPLIQVALQYFRADAQRKRADKTRDRADVDRARRQLEEVLSRARSLLPPHHFLLALLMGDMAEFERNHENMPRALALIHEAFEIARQVAPTHPYFIDALAKYAQEMANRRQYDESERALIEALDAIVARDERGPRAPQFRDYLGRILSLPRYRQSPELADALRKKYE